MLTDWNSLSNSVRNSVRYRRDAVITGCVPAISMKDTRAFSIEMTGTKPGHGVIQSQAPLGIKLSGGCAVLRNDQFARALGAILPTVLFGLAMAFAAPAQAQKQITINSFKSSSLWPIWVAQKQGFFEKQGLLTKNMYTANSVSQMVGLIRGDFEMVTTALDNVIAYAEGEGSPNAPKDADLVAFLGGNNGALSLIARSDIKSIKDLKGKDTSRSTRSAPASLSCCATSSPATASPPRTTSSPPSATPAHAGKRCARAKLSPVCSRRPSRRSRSRRATPTWPTRPMCSRLSGHCRGRAPGLGQEQSRYRHRLHPRLSPRPRLAAGPGE